jgi:hypothetical protein
VSTPFVPRAPVLPSPRRPGEQGRRNAPPAGAATAPAYRVLQSRREPSQRCLFLRYGALDVE